VKEKATAASLTHSSNAVSYKPASKPASKPELTRESVAVSSKLSSPAIIVTEAMCCKGLLKEKKTAEDAIKICENGAEKRTFCSAFTATTACELCFQKFCETEFSKAAFKTQCAATVEKRKGKSAATKKEEIADKAEEVKEDADEMTRTPKRTTRYHDMVEVKEKAKAKAASLTY